MPDSAEEPGKTAEFDPASIAPVAYAAPLRSYDLVGPAPPFYDHREVYPFLEKAIMPYYDAIMAEMKVRTAAFE